MKKYFTGICALLAALCVSLFFEIVAIAQEVLPPSTVEEATSWLPELLQAIIAGDYRTIGCIVVMILMVVVRQILLPKWKIGEDALPWINVAIATFAFGALSFLAPEVSFGQALAAGFSAALLAAGGWDLLGKHLMKMLFGWLGIEMKTTVKDVTPSHLKLK